MLVLTRKLREVIQIGDDVEVTVLAIKGNRIKLGIEAPIHVGVQRKELQQTEDESCLATVGSPSDMDWTI